MPVDADSVRSCGGSTRQRAIDEVDDDVRVDVEQDEPLADESIFEVVGDARQHQQDLRRDRRFRHGLRIAGVDRQPAGARILVEQRTADRGAVRPFENARELTAKVGANRLAENVPLAGPGASTLPMVVYSKVKMGVTPEINALATIIVVLVAVGVGVAGLVMHRRRPEA